jgi:AbrB family looped-hinge helix DNA binding protein
MITTMTRRGQTVVPADIRHRFHIQNNAKLEWMTDGDTIRVIPIPSDPIRGARGIAKGSGLFRSFMDDRKQERDRAQR